MKKKIFLNGFILIVLLALTFTSCCQLFNKKKSSGDANIVIPPQSRIISTSKLGEVADKEICIVLKDEIKKKDAEKIAATFNGKIIGFIEYINLYQVEITNSGEEGILSAIAKAEKMENVIYAFPDIVLERRDFKRTGCNPFEDDTYKGTNGFPQEMMCIWDAWNIIKASGVELNKTVIGVSDDPIYTHNIELNGEAKVKSLYEKEYADILENKEEIEAAKSDFSKHLHNKILSHGNEVTNIIAANSSDGGVCGVASLLGDKLNINVNEIAVISDEDYKQYEKNEDYLYENKSGKKVLLKEIVSMIKQVENGSKIINVSYGTSVSEKSSDEEKIIYKSVSATFKKYLEKMAKEKPDVVFVGAAGNTGIGTTGENDFWGQNISNTVTVGALNSNGQRSNYSMYASGNGEVTISAFDNIIPFGNKSPVKGTSFTAPQVTGVIALMKSIDPELKGAEIKEILKKTSGKNFKGKDIAENMGGGYLKADDAVLETINRLQKKQNKPPFTKEYLLSLSNIEVKASGGSKDYEITATLEGVSEKGTSVEINVTGSNFLISGNKTKSLSSPGSVSWEVTLNNPGEAAVVKVTRLDTKNCMVVMIGGELTAEQLAGEWSGSVTYDDWSTPYKMAEKQIEKSLKAGKGEEIPLNITAKFISENKLSFTLRVSGGKALSNKTFTFEDGKLNSKFSDMMTSYSYSADVSFEGGNIKLSGNWSSKATGLTMNGKWSAVLEKAP